MSKEMDNFKGAMQQALQSVMCLENANNQLRDLNRDYKTQIIHLKADLEDAEQNSTAADLRDQLAVMTARATTAEAQLAAIQNLLGLMPAAPTGYGTGAGELAADNNAMVEHSK